MIYIIIRYAIIYLIVSVTTYSPVILDIPFNAKY